MRKNIPSLVLAMIMSGMATPFLRPLTEEEKRRREQYLKERAHNLNPVDMSEREFVINGEKIMARNKKTAKMIYAKRHPKKK